MKCIILFSLVALCYSLPMTIRKGKHINLDEDGTITIIGSQDKTVVISRAEGSTGQRNVEIFMEDKTVPVKKIWFKEQSMEGDSEIQKAMTEKDILVEIFKKYQGDINDDTYEDILEQIRHFVKTDQVDVNVLNILKSIDSDEDHEDYSTEMEGSMDTKSLQKLLKLLKGLGMDQETIDIDRLVRKDPTFIKRLVKQEPLFGINKKDLIYLNSLIRSQQEPSRHHQMIWLPKIKQSPVLLTRQGMPLDFDTMEMDQEDQDSLEQLQYPRLTKEDLMDMKIILLMQDPRYQHLFVKPNVMMGHDEINPDIDTLHTMKYGMDMDDLRQTLMMPGDKESMVMDDVDTRKLTHLVDQMDKDEMVQLLREQMMNQSRQKQNMFTTRDSSMMDPMMKKMMIERMKKQMMMNPVMKRVIMDRITKRMMMDRMMKDRMMPMME
ncbi:unnamed protein product [Phaedon cochleariae]|uniref:Uncharacterized protein n=1 Tax=Phaedon cochleariae TaxID=80249 RepID=A0A9P0DZ58_PHACE|nr:unnamed protein product [Phaedon cochleariae]